MELENKKYYPTPINKRFVEFLNFLYEEKKVQKNVIATTFGLTKTKLSNLLGFGQHISSELIAKAIEIYNVNPYYILLGRGEMFQKQEEEKLSNIVMEEKGKYNTAIEELVETQRKLISNLENTISDLNAEKKVTKSIK